MTTAELHEILDDENRKLTADELKEVMYQLKWDAFNEVLKADGKEDIYHLGYYNGETNAFQICLDLLEHLKGAEVEGKWVQQISKDKNGKCFNYAPSCSVCGYVDTEMTEFCPNCGAKMKGGAE